MQYWWGKICSTFGNNKYHYEFNDTLNTLRETDRYIERDRRERELERERERERERDERERERERER